MEEVPKFIPSFGLVHMKDNVEIKIKNWEKEANPNHCVDTKLSHREL